ncbi:hypothetical protein SEA_JAYCOOKIE_6 [Arthrobacter phage JayCookie]|uniref:Uncharacterized protein n=3 Tax=Klausavirus princesstrina TaxID=1984784 RepID=A0A0U4K1G4_9CAUD|nr:immunity protein [Arthrobacter phage PrincessTrina]ALY09852.1 hypothetical protein PRINCESSTRINA_6 [Arthrobacter phage PrincessTrina]ASZ73217.1 hypothetical protein SEA_JAYCOOKIE_6 [Arthrobacter phage JayCookie]QEQ94507.1 hypothetical protein SEA_LINUS_6 [Arthrobacter phage Linus]
MAQITFEEARAAVRAQNHPIWEDNDTPGEYMVAGYGWENDESYLLVEGAREYLEDGDNEYVIQDAPAVFVDKETGTVVLAEFLAVFEVIASMTPVPGHEPPTDPDDDE